MQEFNIDSFVELLRKNIYDNFPYENDLVKMSKHMSTPLNIRDVAFMDNPIEVGENNRAFNIGNYYAEKEYPYYHILQEAEVIRKRNRGTGKSKGSQANVQTTKIRDYNKVSFNGKTYSREYTKNVRGARSKVDKVLAPKLMYVKGKYKIDRDSLSPYYVNKHYQYIDRILDIVLPWVAEEFGGKMKRKVIGSLEEDYNYQQTHEENERYMLENMLLSYELD